MTDAMHTEDGNHSSQKTHTGEPSGSPDADLLRVLQEELGAISQVATEGLRFTSAIVQLGLREASHALAGLPSLIVLWLSLWQLALITWLTIVGFVGWLTYDATQSIALAILSSIIIQVIGLGVCAARINSLQHRFNMQRTKALLKVAKDSINAKV